MRKRLLKVGWRGTSVHFWHRRQNFVNFGFPGADAEFAKALAWLLPGAKGKAVVDISLRSPASPRPGRLAMGGSPLPWGAASLGGVACYEHDATGKPTNPPLTHHPPGGKESCLVLCPKSLARETAIFLAHFGSFLPSIACKSH